MICFNGIDCDGVLGRFRANADMIGWKSGPGGEAQVHECSTVKRAEWLEGKLRIQCKDEDLESVLNLKGFSPGDFDILWQYFDFYCGVRIVRHPNGNKATQETEESEGIPTCSPESAHPQNSMSLLSEHNCSVLEDDLVEAEEGATVPANAAGDNENKEPPASSPTHTTSTSGYKQPPSVAPTPSPTTAPIADPLKAGTVWHCPKCTLENPNSKSVCNACKASRPKDEEKMKIRVMNP